MTIKSMETRCWLCTAFALLTVTELTNPTSLHLSLYSANCDINPTSLQGVAKKDNNMAAAMYGLCQFYDS